jgi:hypothetical protein
LRRDWFRVNESNSAFIDATLRRGGVLYPSPHCFGRPVPNIKPQPDEGTSHELLVKSPLSRPRSTADRSNLSIPHLTSRGPVLHECLYSIQPASRGASDGLVERHRAGFTLKSVLLVTLVWAVILLSESATVASFQHSALRFVRRVRPLKGARVRKPTARASAAYGHGLLELRRSKSDIQQHLPLATVSVRPIAS